MNKVINKPIKTMGFIRQVQKDSYSMRLRIAGGQVGTEHLKKIYEIAQAYGKGYIHITSRQGIEIPFIKLQDIIAVKCELDKVGLELGSSGSRVRAVTACQGSTICSSGLIDTTALACELDKRYFAKDLPHKFKIGVTGCRNNCLKAEENDLGIKGGIQPTWEKANCNFCGVCEAVCPGNVIRVDKGTQNLVFDKEKCINCGRCVKSCPVGAWQGKNGFLIYFGGTLGKQIATGKQLIPMVFEKNELIRIIEDTLAFYEKNGKPKERFSQTLERVGWELLEKELSSSTNKEVKKEVNKDIFSYLSDVVAR